ncbi:MAG: hypothetical protein J0I09_06945 [Sphingobacteriia bacterium]|nr:hypothetical protein [Sphingobacteriia bacterium]
MSNRFSDSLFQLIHSLEKSEKRHFKLYIKRSSAKEDLKMVQLFDVLDKMQEYDEASLFKKIPTITRPQLANLKNHLYKQLLASLRLLKSTNNIDLQLTENLDYARLLYNKGLKLQALKILEKTKELAKTHQKFNFLVPVLSLEKKIETLHITRSTTDKTEQITSEALYISGHVFRVTKLSNLALLLYRWYVIHGHARNEHDEKDVKVYFKNQLPEDVHLADSFYEKMYLFQSYCWYAFIRQDFLMYYRYSQKWVDVFVEHPLMKLVETGHYIKGMHTLLNAHFDLRNFSEFDRTLKDFEAFEKTDMARMHDNFRTHTSIYINSAKINGYIMKGTFKEGVALIPFIEEKLEEYGLYVDRHRILVFNYKFATLHFGNGDYGKAIDYLLKIINGPLDLRIDLQCYARLLHLMSHYELGNFDLIESLTKSVYRFMSKMKNLTVVEEEMFRFVKSSFGLSLKQLKPELEKFLNDVKHLEKNRFETRAFAYLDIISWLESKVHEKPLSTIIHNKYLQSKRK